MPKNDHLKDLNVSPVYTAKLLENKKSSKSPIGEKIMRSKLRALGERAPNDRPIEVARVFLFAKGDVVPAEIAGASGVKVDAARRALGAWADGWCQSHWDKANDWDNSWGECWDNSTAKIAHGIAVMNTIATGVRAFKFSEFSPAEIRALARLGIKR